MKKEITKLIISCLLLLLTTQNLKAQEEIKLIGFTSNGETINNIVKWNAGDTDYLETNPVDFIGLLAGSSVYNSKIGEYYSRVLVEENDDYISKIFKYSSQDNSISLNEVTSFYNGSAEIDMQTGMLYSYDGNTLENDIYLNRYNPVTQTSTNLGNYELPESTVFFPDSSCFDSDSGIYYFIIQDEEGKKLVKSIINSDSFTYTIIPITDQTLVGNMGLEYSNEENTLHVIYPEFNFETETSTMNVGKLNENTGEITNVLNIAEITALQLFNRTYDQNTEVLVFIGVNLNNEQRLYLFNTLTSQVENRPLPQSIIYEIEADNYLFAQARYNALSIDESLNSSFLVSPNPTTDSFSVNFNGSNPEYELFDILGKSILKGIAQNGQEINVGNLNKGVYILNLKSDSSNENKKLIIN